ncbi:hypothetical protein AVEN_165882-1 [Araneus ventricosus]|uniref:Uncharacterized protein n=1 Tax=Araneus ventricosus TaxID=182803 RepID=A0A4Y2JB54_ARAVE|nr:hypothetical protein AVEN_165882-1 [Araneus ventricosus]
MKGPRPEPAPHSLNVHAMLGDYHTPGIYNGILRNWVSNPRFSDPEAETKVSNLSRHDPIDLQSEKMYRHIVMIADNNSENVVRGGSCARML